MSTSIIGNGSPGAGRLLDNIWPRAGGALTTGLFRNGADVANLIQQSSTVSGPTRYRGRYCYYTAAAAAVGGSINYVGYIPQPMVRKSSANLFGSDDTLCIRYVFLMAFDDCADIGTKDSGCYVCAGGSVSYLDANAAPGFGFQRRATNDVRLLVKTTNVANYAVNLPIAGIVTADWNAYEFRWIAPTSTTEGQLKCIINSKTVATYPHGAGTVLPDGERAGPSYGWTPFMVNWQNAVAQSAYYAGMHVIIGPTESSLL